MTIVELAQHLMRTERIGWSLAIHIAHERRAEAEARREQERQDRAERRRRGGA